MTTKHMSKPYKVSLEEPDEFWYGAGFYAINIGGYTVPVGKGLSNAKAHAYLLAAAPALLAACKAAEGFCSSGPFDAGNDYEQGRKRILAVLLGAAIAAAEKGA